MKLIDFALPGGDILFNTRNSVELVGKTGIVTGEASGFIYNNNLMRIRTKPDVLPLRSVPDVFARLS